MTAGRGDGEGTKASNRPADARKNRLAEQLRTNLLRRKQQARARRSGEADQRLGLGRTEKPDGEQGA